MADLCFTGPPSVGIQLGPHHAHPLDLPDDLNFTIDEACLVDMQSFDFDAADVVAITMRGALKSLLQAAIQDAQARAADPNLERPRPNNFEPNTYDSDWQPNTYTLTATPYPTKCLVCFRHLGAGARCYGLDRAPHESHLPLAFLCFRCNASRGSGKGKSKGKYKPPSP